MRWLGQSHRVTHQLSPNVNPLDTAKGQKQTLGRTHIVSTSKGTHWAVITLCQHRRWMHCAEITLRQHRQRRRHWVEIILCQHHRRHSRRGIAKNSHSLCMSLDCRRQDQCKLKNGRQGCIVGLESRPARTHSQRSHHTWRTSY